MAIQSDGKIVVAGSSYDGGGTGYDFALVRYNPDGTLDSTFDSDGIVTTDLAHGGPNSEDHAYAVAIDANGSVYVADTANHRVRRVSGGVITIG